MRTNKEKPMTVSLKDKFLGCIAGAHIGSAFGAADEGWPPEKVRETYGFMTKLEPYGKGSGWEKMAGTTEDGIERQKFMITAIIEKKDRVTADDVRDCWVRDMNRNAPGNISEPFEAILLALAEADVPGRDIGKFCDYSGLNSFSRACHPIGLINAGDPQGAKEDILEVGQLYQRSNSRGLQWAIVTGVAIAAACKPDATVDSVIGAVMDNTDPDMVVKELSAMLKATEHCSSVDEIRTEFDKVYNSYGMVYAFAYANEVVTKGICIFSYTKGNVKDAIITAANCYRDTDCICAVAGGISGALTGPSGIPDDWLTQMDKALEANLYTHNKRTIRQDTDLLYNTYLERLGKLKAYAAYMDY
jgi:ADP-ribosylglycohydrolase